MHNGVCYNPTMKLREYDKTVLDVNDMKNLVVEIEENGYVKEYAIDFKKFLKDYGIKNIQDAYGVTVYEGDTVFTVDDGREWLVNWIDNRYGSIHLIDKDDKEINATGNQITHKQPVLDADGVPINVGDTVWDKSGKELTVTRFDPEYKWIVKCSDGFDHHIREIFHRQPDSLELIHEDEQLLFDEGVYSYCDKYDLPYGSVTVRDIAIDHISNRYREVLERKFKN